jgi:hypothetical protein
LKRSVSLDLESLFQTHAAIKRSLAEKTGTHLIAKESCKKIAVLRFTAVSLDRFFWHILGEKWDFSSFWQFWQKNVP